MVGEAVGLAGAGIHQEVAAAGDGAVGDDLVVGRQLIAALVAIHEIELAGIGLEAARGEAVGQRRARHQVVDAVAVQIQRRAQRQAAQAVELALALGDQVGVVQQDLARLAVGQAVEDEHLAAFLAVDDVGAGRVHRGTVGLHADRPRHGQVDLAVAIEVAGAGVEDAHQRAGAEFAGGGLEQGYAGRVGGIQHGRRDGRTLQAGLTVEDHQGAGGAGGILAGPAQGVVGVAVAIDVAQGMGGAAQRDVFIHGSGITAQFQFADLGTGHEDIVAAAGPEQQAPTGQGAGEGAVGPGRVDDFQRPGSVQRIGRGRVAVIAKQAVEGAQTGVGRIQRVFVAGGVTPGIGAAARGDGGRGLVVEQGIDQTRARVHGHALRVGQVHAGDAVRRHQGDLQVIDPGVLDLQVHVEVGQAAAQVFDPGPGGRHRVEPVTAGEDIAAAGIARRVAGAVGEARQRE